MPEEVIQTPGIDMCCRGEGEMAILELVQKMEAGEDYSGVESIWVKDADGTIHRNPVRPLLEDIDVLPLPDFDIFDFDKLLGTQIKTGVVILSRGCPYSCTYCSNKKMRAIYPNQRCYSRFHSPEYSIEYLKKLKATYPEMEYLNFKDDILPWKDKWLETFTTAYKKEIGLPFICNYRANHVTPEIVRMLRDAGCYQMFFGVESGNDIIRNEVLNRKMKREQIKVAFDACRAAGIKTVAYNMVGLPFEDKGTVLDTIKLNVEIKSDHALAPIYYPYPDTELFEMAVVNGWVEPIYDYREDKFVDQPSLPRDQLYFAQRYFRTFLGLYRGAEKLPDGVRRPVERALDRIWLSPHLPHRTLVKVQDGRRAAAEKAKSTLRDRNPEMYLKLRDTVRGVRALSHLLSLPAAALQLWRCRLRCLPLLAAASALVVLSSFVKNSRARFVLVCCSPWRSTPRSIRYSRTLVKTSKRSGRRALGGELEDAAAVRVEPQLGDELVGELWRRESHLEHEDRPEDREVVELEALRGVCRVEGALVLVEHLADRRLPEADQLGLRRGR